MTTIKLKFVDDATVTLGSLDIGDGFAMVLSSSVDFETTGVAPVAIAYEFVFLTGTGCVDFVHLRGFWSIDDSDFSDLNNPMDIRAVKCLASTTIKAVGSFPVEARYIKFDYLNESGGIIEAATTTPTLILREIHYEQT